MMQRRWNEVSAGEVLEPALYPLSLMRLVMAAGANRDFNSIHHNAEFARASGAPDMYANTYFLQGMWERCVRRYIGPAGNDPRHFRLRDEGVQCRRRYGDRRRAGRAQVAGM